VVENSEIEGNNHVGFICQERLHSKLQRHSASFILFIGQSEHLPGVHPCITKLSHEAQS
jgi:hypothetical protein